MRFLGKKTSPRRSQVRKNMAAERLSQISRLANADFLGSLLLWLLFVVLCIPVVSLELIPKPGSEGELFHFPHVIPLAVMISLISVAAAFYIYRYQGRIIRNRTRALAIVGLFIVLLGTTKLGVLLTGHIWWATGSAVTAAIILTIAYNQRFAIGMSIFYCVFAYFASGAEAGINLFLTMAAGAVACCFSLREIRTRMKLLEVSTLAAGTR
jgi:hypothetical protein